MYEISTLFIYKFIFISELIVSEILFSWKLRKKEKWWIRLLIALIIMYGIVAAYPIGDFSYNFWYTSIMFFIFFVISLTLLKFIFNESFRTLIFIGLASYTVQHFSYEIYNLTLNFFNLWSSNGIFGYDKAEQTQSIFTGVTLTIYIFVYADCYWLGYFLFGSQIKKGEELIVKNYAFLVLLLAFLIVDILLNALVTYHSYKTYDKLYLMTNEFYNVLCCCFILLMQFSFLRERNLENQVNIYTKLLDEQKKQYELSKNNINLLNIKCHDLKHQLITYASKKEISEEEIKEMSDIISEYESFLDTGNEALNIVIREKESKFKKHNIQLSVIADGKELNFLKDNEIYSLFGNALDNAYEALKHVSKDKRFISLVVQKRNGFVNICIRNYFDENIKFEKDSSLPSTTKDDKINHGFGLKSIQYIVDKYEGDLLINTEDNVFNLNILFPIPK